MSKEFNRLLGIVAKLRSPDGCEWDRKQTLYSLKEDFISEAYELFEAIDNKDIDNIKEELGDILLHVTLHSQIASENGLFDIDNVINEICDKMIRRHPHVFGKTTVEDTEEILKNWEAIKSRERGNKKKKVLDKAKKPMPVIKKAFMLQDAAAEKGFDWQTAKQVMLKVKEENEELMEAINSGDKNHIEEELGDIIFALVNLGRHCGVSAENALAKANIKFIERFEFIESSLESVHKSFEESSLEEMEELWQKAKKHKLRKLD